MSLRAPYSQNKESGSIRLDIDTGFFAHFPTEIIWNGLRLLKKDEFHITLLHAKQAPELIDVSNKELASFFDSFVEQKPIKLTSFLDDFRYIEEDEKKTVVVRCVVSNLNKLFILFNQTFSTQLPIQSPHVTLYTLQENIGIHINSDEKMESLERVHFPELEKALEEAQSAMMPE